MTRRTLLAALPSTALLAQAPGALDRLAWLAGRWTGTVGKSSYEEYWMEPAGGAMLGVSRTIAGPRMRTFEYLRIVQRGDDLFYVAQPNGVPPTEFKLTSLTDSKAVFANPDHDFPKTITYERTAPGALVATIAGDGRQLQFHLKR